jgi:decaprenyl-phosphate phosphoribosyltransferase
LDDEEDEVMNFLSTISRLLRAKQWLKNLLILAAPLGAGISPSISALEIFTLGFIGFSLSASAIYVLNDFRDRHLDRDHPQKKYRPIAAGLVSEKIAIPISILLVLGALVSVKDFGSEAILTICCYMLINILYTFRLKSFPVLELGIVAAGYSLRILFGAQIFGLVASSWLMISTFAAAFGVIAAKRRSELDDLKRSKTSKRKVLDSYSSASLQATSTLAFGTAFTTYSLWLFEHSVNLQILPLFCQILALVIFAFLLIESDRGELESPEDLVNSFNFMSIFAIFAVLNLVLLYI